MRHRTKKEKRITWIVFGIIFVCILVGLVLILTIDSKNKDFNSFQGMPENFKRGEMSKGDFNGGGTQMQEISEEEISEIESFFDLSPTEEEFQSYCQENMFYCIYYCMSLNSESNYCENLMPSDMENRIPPEGFD